MPANLGTESTTVQHSLTRYASQAGWTIVPKEEATTFRRGESGLLFYDLLKQKLQDLNPGVVTAELADDIIHRLESVRNNIEGNSEILAWLRGERSVYVEAEKRQRNVTLIDFKEAVRNAFHVTEEWEYTNGNNTNRADDVFLINGIPVALVECKSAEKDKAMEEALTQIRRYHKETPEMVTTPQVFDFSHLIEFFYGVTWNLDRKTSSPGGTSTNPITRPRSKASSSPCACSRCSKIGSSFTSRTTSSRKPSCASTRPAPPSRPSSVALTTPRRPVWSGTPKAPARPSR
jgi:hypothetical protein